MAYLWSDSVTIQSYLDASAGFEIGEDGTFTENVVQLYENDAVTDIRVLLSAAWTGVEDLNSVPFFLSNLAAKLAAARLSAVKVGSNQGQVPGGWADTYKQEVFASIARMVVNAETFDIPGLTLRVDYDVIDALFKVKQREYFPER